VCGVTFDLDQKPLYIFTVITEQRTRHAFYTDPSHVTIQMHCKCKAKSKTVPVLLFN